MKWPTHFKGGGRWWRFVIGERDIVSESEYTSGELDETEGTLEISDHEGDHTLSIVFHELVHVAQIMLGIYETEETSKGEDEGNEDQMGQVAMALVADNPQFWFEVMIELQPPHLRDDLLRYMEKRIKEIRTAPVASDRLPVDTER